MNRKSLGISLVLISALIFAMLTGCGPKKVPEERFIGTWVDILNANIEYEISEGDQSDLVLRYVATDESIPVDYSKGELTFTVGGAARIGRINQSGQLVFVDQNEQVLARARRK